MTWPAIILWLMILLASVSRGPLILYLFSGTVIFGALTMAPPGLTGGLNLPAQTICAIILLIKIFLRSDNLMLAIRQGLDIRKLGLLGFFMVYVLVTALVYPRLFGGSVMLYSLNAAAAESVLAPTSANFTQTIYLLISSALVFAFATAGRSPTFRKIYLQSIIFAGVLLVASGVIDLACSMAGLSRLLQPFHNAAYASLDTVYIAGQYRVVGFMPEASDYGTATCTVLSFLLFTYRFFDAGLRRYFLPILMMALALMTLMSTSSTGYLGLIMLVLLFVGRLLAGLILIPVRSQAQWQRAGYVLGALIIFVAVMSVAGPYLFSKYYGLLNDVLLSKTTSSSYLERSRWSQAGLQAFFATYGFGVGVGSVRTSNWFINILASTGLFGVFLFGTFVIKLILPYRKYADEVTGRFAIALKLSIVPAALMIGVSGTTPDPGVWVMSVLGLLYGLRLRPQNAVQEQPAPELRLDAGAQNAV
jgi:hypothetical protein